MEERRPPHSFGIAELDDQAIRPFPLLGLPNELLVEVASWVYTSHPRDVIFALSLTCKLIAAISRTLIFRSLRFSKLPSNIKEFPSHYGLQTKSLVLEEKLRSFRKGMNEDYWALMPRWVRMMPSLQHLELRLSIPSLINLEEFVEAIANLSHLRVLIVERAGRWPTGDGESLYNILSSIIPKIAHQLTHIRLAQDLWLPQAVLDGIIQKASRLETLEFDYEISLNLRLPFLEAHSWACATSLKRFEAKDSPGLHATMFSHFVIRGTWPNLEFLHLDACGSEEDLIDMEPPPADQWKLNQPALRHFTMIHFVEWEMIALSRIRTYSLTVKDIDMEEFTAVLDMDGSWTKLERVYVKDDDIIDEELVEGCKRRNIELQNVRNLSTTTLML